MVAIPVCALAADFDDAADGDWNAGGMDTWGAGVGNFPGAADNVTIDSHTVTVTADAEANDLAHSGGSLRINGGTSLVLYGTNTTFSNHRDMGGGGELVNEGYMKWDPSGGFTLNMATNGGGAIFLGANHSGIQVGSGSLVNDGLMHIDTGSNGAHIGGDGEVVNNGLLRVETSASAGKLEFWYGGKMRGASGSVTEFDGSMRFVSGFDPESGLTVDAGGILRKTGAGTLSMDGNGSAHMDFRDGGTVEVREGTLKCAQKHWYVRYNGSAPGSTLNFRLGIYDMNTRTVPGDKGYVILYIFKPGTVLTVF